MPSIVFKHPLFFFFFCFSVLTSDGREILCIGRARIEAKRKRGRQRERERERGRTDVFRPFLIPNLSLSPIALHVVSPLKFAGRSRVLNPEQRNAGRTRETEKCACICRAYTHSLLLLFSLMSAPSIALSKRLENCCPKSRNAPKNVRMCEEGKGYHKTSAVQPWFELCIFSIGLQGGDISRGKRGANEIEREGERATLLHLLSFHV